SDAEADDEDNSKARIPSHRKGAVSEDEATTHSKANGRRPASPAKAEDEEIADENEDEDEQKLEDNGEEDE
ncbi:hypothetical protein LTR29_018346, partial [Friedmanniomyces endolithicus]